MTQAGTSWYYAVGQDRAGPIDIMTLRQMLAGGQIHAQTLVWKDGMPNWIPAIAHPDLAIAAQQHQQQQQQFVSGQPLPYYGYAPTGEAYYAGFWLRFAAWVVDFIVTAAAGCFVGLIVGFIIGFYLGVTRGTPPDMEGPGYTALWWGLSILMAWLYYALMESSATQGTLGKMACSIKVTDEDGQRISFGRATGRFFGRYLSALLVFVGFIMIGVTERKQGLHDLMAGTLVVRK